MTDEELRDYFAAHAPTPSSYALSIKPPAYPPDDASPEDYAAYQKAYALWEADAMATWAYTYADAMIEARKT